MQQIVHPTSGWYLERITYPVLSKVEGYNLGTKIFFHLIMYKNTEKQKLKCFDIQKYICIFALIVLNYIYKKLIIKRIKQT